MCVCVLLVIYSHTSQIKGQRQLPGHLDLGHPGGTSSPVGALKTHTLTQTHIRMNFVQERKTLTVAIEMFHGARRSQGEIEEEEEEEGYREG